MDGIAYNTIKGIACNTIYKGLISIFSCVNLVKGEKEAFLQEFGHSVEKQIYAKYKSKNDFLSQTGFHKKTLHDILTGTVDTHISVVYRLSKALDLPFDKMFVGLDPSRIERLPRGKSSK